MHSFFSVRLLLPFTLLLTLLAAACLTNAAPISHIGTGQRVLVICIKFDDQASTRLAGCADWVTLLNNEIANFYDEATHGQTTFTFESPAGVPDNGWLSLGYDSTDFDFYITSQDAIDLIDPYVDFTGINRIVIITNHSGFGGTGGAGWWWAVNDGVEQTFVEDGADIDKRFMSLSVTNEWIANWGSYPFDAGGAVVAHELGHQLNLKTHYGTIGWFPGGPRNLITPWDVMGQSPELNHFLGWGKLERQWTPGAGVQTIGPPTTVDLDQTIALSPSETAGGTDLIKIPVTNGPVFTGYTVETRRQINGDENLPSAGVILSYVDENPATIRKAIVLEDPGSPGNLRLAPLEVGDDYSVPARNLTITHVSNSGDDANVRVEYRLPPALPPNPQITPWGAPPWETTDVWVDSEKNGWGVYRYIDGSGNPVGNGDDAWVDHDNRIYFRISNGGTGDASNVNVQVYANEPPGVGDRGADWLYLGTAIFSTITAGGSETGYVTWKPVLGEHTCIKVVIVEQEEEITGGDNVAQENVTAFDTSTGSPYRPRCHRFLVNNPFETRETPVHMLVRDIPEGWVIQVEPTHFVLPPAESESICMTVFPRPEEAYEPGFIGVPKIEALIPLADTFIPIGGIDVWTHLTTDTRLTCDSNGPDRLGDDAAQAMGLLSEGLAPDTPLVDPSRPPMDSKALDRLFRESAIIRPEPEPVAVSSAEEIQAAGRLLPGFSGATVAVDFISGEQRETRLTTTDAGGNWNLTFDPEVGGLWEVKAYFAGDATRAAADSNRCRFQVERPTCECAPGTFRIVHWLALGLGIFALALFFIQREQRCRNAKIAATILIALAVIGLIACWHEHLASSFVILAIALAILLWWYVNCVRRGKAAATTG